MQGERIFSIGKIKKKKIFAPRGSVMGSLPTFFLLIVPPLSIYHSYMFILVEKILSISVIFIPILSYSGTTNNDGVTITNNKNMT